MPGAGNRALPSSSEQSSDEEGRSAYLRADEGGAPCWPPMLIIFLSSSMFWHLFMASSMVMMPFM